MNSSLEHVANIAEVRSSWTLSDIPELAARPGQTTQNLRLKGRSCSRDRLTDGRASAAPAERVRTG